MDCRDARLHCLFASWMSLRGGRAIPDRSALDCAAISSLLPYVWICRLAAETGRFPFRLAGDEIRWLLGRPVSGAHADDLLPNIAGSINATLTAVLHQPAVCYFRGLLPHADLFSVEAETLALPLADGDHATTVLAATIFAWPSTRASSQAAFAAQPGPMLIPVSAL
ncbi:PAS domain-containing protein [Dongia sp.]|uniref:PAS domain-containing protein n=1 Tax=Dongia sp. TaxID=1977262 RepID=UPI00375220DD